MAIVTSKGIKLEYRDLGLKNVMRGVRAFGDMSLRVGVVGPKAAERTADGRLTNAENAVIQAFGLGGARPRDFINKPLTKNKDVIKRTLANAVRRALGRFIFDPSVTTIETALDDAGRVIVKIPRDAIMDHEVPPRNRPTTIAKKGFDHPLIDHLDLYDAISYRIVRGSGDVLEAGATEFEAFEIGGDVNPNASKVG